MKTQMKMACGSHVSHSESRCVQTTNNVRLRLFMAAVLACAGFLALPCAQVGFAQTNGRASVTGVVADSSGAVISGATVTATNVSTGVTTGATTNGAGSYSILYLEVGTYNLQATRDGFQTDVKSGLLLTADQVAGINFSMLPGQVTQRVVVTASGELLDTETSSLGQVIDAQSISELPLNGRNPATLVLLTPGVADASPLVGGNQQYTTFPSDSAASTNGGRRGSTYYILDGAPNMDDYQLMAAPFPNPDATQEFRVISNNFDAQYGFAPGGVVSIVTKSGTNSWHGNAFDFLRNTDFNAEDYFAKSAPTLRQNQFGGSLGGPIIKNKLFVFGNYQGTRSSQVVYNSTQFVPSVAMLHGDWSALLNPSVMGGAGNTIQLVNPATGAPYAGNQIPTGSYNPASVAIAGLLPSTTDPLGHIQATQFGEIQDFNENTVRVDWAINDHHHLSGRSFLNYFNQPSYSATLLDSNRSWTTNWQNYSGTWTWTISPTIVNSYTSSYSRMFDNSHSGLLVNGKPLCFSSYINVAEPQPCSTFPMAVGGNGFGFAQNYNAVNRWTATFTDSINITKGRHLMVAGVDVLRQYFIEDTDWHTQPIIDFGNTTPFTGYAMADFLLGDADYFQQGGGEYNTLYINRLAPYFTDQFKATPHLTFTAGVRWEPYLAPNVIGGRIAIWNPNHQSTRYPNAPLGMMFPGDSGVPAHGIPSTYNFFDPRIGFAWQPPFSPNTSIRAGFGMFMDAIEFSSWDHAADTQPFSPQYTFQTGTPVTSGSAPVGVIPFSNPWTVFTPTGGVSPFPPFPGPSYSPNSSVTFVTPTQIDTAFTKNFRQGRTTSWNLSVEHVFFTNWLMRVAYVGVSSSNQALPIELNPGYYSANPNLSGTRAHGQMASIAANISEGSDNYNGGQFTLERKFANGIQFQANYTRSKTIDDGSSASLAWNGDGITNPFDIGFNRGISSLDVPQIFVANFVYESPALTRQNQLIRTAFGKWELSAIYKAQSGNPIGIGSGTNNSGSDVYGDWADLVPGQPFNVHQGPKSQWINEYFNTNAFTINPPGSFGNSGRANFYGPGINDWDTNFSKNFQIERFNLQVRWEMFNALNHTMFGNPASCVCNGPGSFGHIYGTNGSFPARIGQAAMKLSF